MPAQNSQCPPGRGHPSPSPRTVSFADDLATRKNTKGGPPNQHPPTNTEDVSLPHVDSQQQLNQYREQLARDLERRELASRGPATDHGSKSRVSPIQEEAAAATAAAAAEHVASVASILSSPHALSSGRASVASTESGNTIRGGMTPGYVAATPSYPFPRMTTPGMGPGFMHHPFANLSPSTLHFMSQTMSFDHFAHDKVLSNSSTPASTMTFHPSGATHQQDYGDYPTPHLYDLSLMLGAEPGLEAWWGTVVQILRDVYKAERVTLAVPADSTDIENVPWGQKATYNEHEEDELSLGYMARGSSLVPSSADELSQATPASNDSLRPQSPARPGLHSRHSFTSYENIRDPAAAGAAPQPPSRRPSHLFRSQSYFPPGRTPDDFQHGTNNPTLNQASLAEHNAEDEQAPGWEEPAGYPKDGKGRVLPMLQALDFEADPLIDHSGITRVLERGKVIALTRSYPYLQNLPPEAPAAKPGDPSPGSAKAPEAAAKKKRPKRPLGESSTTKLSMLLGGAAHLGAEKAPPSSKISRLDQESPKPPTPQYEEYEQAPPSPWSQSPAPSPAIRSDTKENPFFADAMVDEDSFNPTSAPQDYTAMPPPEAIGVENSWTVLHIPLTHLLLSEPHRPFKLDNAALEHKSHNRAHGIGKVEGQPPTPDGARRKSKSTPIAILSILTPVLPYPSNLRHSLEHLAPHMATSFSLARHYTNLETELAGMQRRRPATAGFGAIHSDGRPLMNPSNMASFNFMSSEDIAMPNSLADSLTSPSDYSGLSKSATGSPSGTPNWDQSSLGMVMDARTGSSPAQMAGDSYFSTRTKSNLSKAESTSKSSMPRSRSGSKDSPPLEKRLVRQPSGKIAPQDSTPRPEAHAREAASEGQASRKGSLADEEAAGVPEARPMKTPEANQSRHTLLHSYGADFATSFQSLPPSSSVVSKPAAYNPPSRGASISSGPVDMPPPSDRLKGLMLDALPAHVFVSLPQSGEVVWVNSRYLTYRGQTVADLAADPWGSIHPEDRDDYLKAWSHSLRTGEQFSRTVRIKRFDGAYRWFYARAVASRDKRGVLMQFLGSYMDIHDQHIAELKAARQEEIETSEAKHRLLANLIPQIIFTATEDEGITFANDQWLSYTELARKGIIKVSTDSNGRLSYTTEVRLRSKKGAYRWHLIRCVEIDNIDFGSGASSFFGSATDINDHKLLEAKLKEAMESKSRFLSNMSHEIRTPLIGISGMVSFLQDSVLNEEQRDYTNTIQTSANSLLMIINDILDLSKVDAGMMKLKYEWFHTRALIEDVNELVSTMAIAKRLELNYVVEQNVPTWIKGDKVRIRQVLLNVIGNAIKFTSEGEVFSRCRVYTSETAMLMPNEIMLEFAIIDTGRGFTEEEAELIFKPFSQIDGSSTRQHGGSGLGLVISRQLVELHGGVMEGTAVPGKGSTFTFTARFTLPTENDHPDVPMKLEIPPSDTSSDATPTNDSNKMLGATEEFRPPMYSILIICPQTHSREATTQHIEQTLPKEVPRQITALKSMVEADKLIGGDDPVHFTHIVLNLPSPEELVATMTKIERNVVTDKTTVLVLSDTGQRQAVMKLVAESKQEALLSEERVTFINKPVKPSRFAVIFDPEKVLDSSIDRNRSTAQRMVESQKASYEEIGKRMGNKGYKVLLVEDNSVNQKVLQKYLKKVGVEVEVAADGVECTDMVLARGHEYYSLILCDLHMPRKDGYQACREIREWEVNNRLARMPIIALSANVMSDVQDKCVAAGFSDYVTKPVDFISLSRAMSKFF
ncbi:Peroxide stress-activated histidine kinase mak1 like protein [Verticillium longisporum]|nr:Peroxide stress-activated histidine kinase mak1 like protein [Verticillium longisporum]